MALTIKLKKSKLSGEVIFPPSKSDSHRLLIAAALAEGESIIRGINRCDDVLATIASLRSLGADISLEGDTAIVKGIDVRGAEALGTLPVNESGSTLRFLIPLALLTEKEVRFKGKARLFERPLTIYEDIVNEYGGKFEIGNGELIIGGNLQSGEYRLRGNVSSQFITGLLFALPLLSDDSKIIIEPPFESRPYVNMTIDTLEKFGVKVRFDNENEITVFGNQKYTKTEEKVEGDWSGGAFLVALGLLHPEISLGGYSTDTLQGDSACVDYLGKIKGGKARLDISDCPDLGPILFAMAAYFGEAEFTGTRRLVIKESDRCGAMKAELEKLGASVEIFENSVKIKGGNLHSPNVMLYGHNDHRIVMSLAVLCSILGGEIEGAEAVKKSYPEFFDVLSKLGMGVEISK